MEENYLKRVGGDRSDELLVFVSFSGGGQYGAFGVGFLNGWQETGTRPQFDIVTGVSAGALMATHAFLGTPADDKVLADIFTSVTSDDIYRKKPLLLSLLGGNSLLDTTPLMKLLEKVITPEVLARVAAAYDDNRRLWVGTTNLDYNQTWAWNMTLIARENRPGAIELYRKMLLASASMPVAFPPVEIEGHLLADGGVRSNVLVIGVAGVERPGTPLYGPGTVYVIHNEPRSKTPAAVENGVHGITQRSFVAMMSASVGSVLLRSYFGAKSHGYDFKLVDIADDIPVGDNPLAFDHDQMQAAFDAGNALGRQVDPWQKAPPNLGDYPEWGLKMMIDEKGKR
ncbi:MAG: patatin-like phospholipase family protein [Desulfobacterales bacterium]|jgi:predicted acylesterase/phospholipase RssA